MGLDSLVGRTEVPDSVRAVMTQVVEVLRNSVEAVSSREMCIRDRLTSTSYMKSGFCVPSHTAS